MTVSLTIVIYTLQCPVASLYYRIRNSINDSTPSVSEFIRKRRRYHRLYTRFTSSTEATPNKGNKIDKYGNNSMNIMLLLANSMTYSKMQVLFYTRRVVLICVAQWTYLCKINHMLHNAFSSNSQHAITWNNDRLGVIVFEITWTHKSTAANGTRTRAFKDSM